jgi:hypothetical protein
MKASDDFSSCETTPQYLRRNFNYEASGIKANSGGGAPQPA